MNLKDLSVMKPALRIKIFEDRMGMNNLLIQKTLSYERVIKHNLTVRGGKKPKKLPDLTVSQSEDFIEILRTFGLRPL